MESYSKISVRTLINVFNVYLALRGTDARQPTEKGRDVPFPLAIILGGQAQCVSSGLREEGHLTVKTSHQNPLSGKSSEQSANPYRFTLKMAVCVHACVF